MMTQIKELITQMRKDESADCGKSAKSTLQSAKSTRPLFCRRRTRGQVAPMMVVMIVMAVMMTMVTVNIGKVALLKTNTAIAADTAALGAASTLGTMARAVCASIRGTPNPGLCKKCKFGGIVGNLLIGLVAGIATPAGAYWVFKTLVIDPKQISNLNAAIRKSLPPKLAIKLGAYLTALAGVVDDPRVVPDTTDIDKDGDKTELVSKFAVWFEEERLKPIEAQVIAKLGPEVGEWTERLTRIRRDVQKVVDYLKNDFIPYVQWIENTYDGRCADLPNPASTPQLPLPPVHTCLGPVDVPFWKPGTQGAQLCFNGIPCGDCADPDACADACGIDIVPPGNEDDDNDENVPVIPPPDFPPGLRPCDEVEYVLMSAEAFLQFADAVLNSPYEVRARSLGEWVDALKFFGAVEFESWMEMIDGYPLDRFPRRILGWRQHLSNLKTQMPWPLDPAFGIPWPPGVPNPLPPQIRHPNDYVNGVLKDYKDDILGFWALKLRKKTIDPVDVPIDPKDFIYSWQDKRGWHHVGAEVSDFKLPRPKAQSRSFSTCVVGKRVAGTVKVTVKRFDEDRRVNRLLDFKQRQRSQNPSPNPADKRSLDFGVVSVSEADYWWKNDGIRVKKAK